MKKIILRRRTKHKLIGMATEGYSTFGQGDRRDFIGDYIDSVKRGIQVGEIGLNHIRTIRGNEYLTSTEEKMIQRYGKTRN